MAGEPLVILGAGTMALEVADLISDIGNYELVGFAVDVPRRSGQTLLGLPVWDVDDLGTLARKPILVAGIFSPDRANIIVKLSGFTWATIIHPSASVSKTARIGDGAVINRLVAIGREAEIGAHVLVNRSASVGHNTKICDYTTLGPGVNIAGGCVVGPRALVGMGTNVIQNSRIPADARVRAGMIVMQ